MGRVVECKESAGPSATCTKPDMVLTHVPRCDTLQRCTQKPSKRDNASKHSQAGLVLSVANDVAVITVDASCSSTMTIGVAQDYLLQLVAGALEAGSVGPATKQTPWS